MLVYVNTYAFTHHACISNKKTCDVCITGQFLSRLSYCVKVNAILISSSLNKIRDENSIFICISSAILTSPTLENNFQQVFPHLIYKIRVIFQIIRVLSIIMCNNGITGNVLISLYIICIY